MDRAQLMDRIDRPSCTLQVPSDPTQQVRPYEPTEQMRWAMKRIDPALTHDQCRALWSAAWSAAPTPPAPNDAAFDRFVDHMNAKLAARKAEKGES